MREIKFRAWHKTWSPQKIDESDWHTPGQKINGMQEVKGIWWGNTGKAHVQFGTDDTSIRLGDWRSNSDLKDVELMQFTGFKDKKGVEIYEGDIVKLETYWQEEDELMKSILDVVWHDGGVVLMDKGDFRTILAGETEKVEVIGNIYQNPELLK